MRPLCVDRRVTIVLLGDTPYGDARRAAFPALVSAVNADPHVRFVRHAGGVKNGTLCWWSTRMIAVRYTHREVPLRDERP